MKDPIINPIVTTNTILASKFDGGAVVLLDKLACIGRFKRFQNISRFFKFNDNILIAYSGEVGDFQFIKQELLLEVRGFSSTSESQYKTSPRQVYNFLIEKTHILRRERKPLYNEYLVVGFEDCNSTDVFMGLVDHLGNAFEESLICTGMSRQLASPIIERTGSAKDEVVKEVKEAFKTCFLRKTNTIDNLEMAVLERVGGEIKIEVSKVEMTEMEYFKEDIKGEVN
eukprot:GAHX01000750.1.p1 GENE.GAHX01000750.1~~GAHX01000750.1.p1  ORF type:complete len:227 (-),score=50.02 GAHX01000750.1:29-709(-)